MIFQYVGINNKGQTVVGNIEANTLTLAKIDLRKKGISIHKIVKKRAAFFTQETKKIKAKDLTLLSRQLATLIDSGIPLVQAFQIIARGQVKQQIKELLQKLNYNLETGFTLAEALRKFPNYFNELFCNLVEAGEKSGTLAIMLHRIANYKEQHELIKNKIKKALTYPLVVLLVAITVTFILLIFVVPQFERLFTEFGAELPVLTQLIMKLSQKVVSFGYLLCIILGLQFYCFIYALKHSLTFAKKMDAFLLRLPWIGEILAKTAIMRFSRTLAITFAAGLPLIEALKVVSGTTGNLIFCEATLNIKDQLATGLQLSKSMEHTFLFPKMVIQMVAIGEESGTLEKMLSKIADFYEEDVHTAVDTLCNLLEPVLMTLIGILVGGIVLAMYLPIFKLGTAL